VLTGAGLSAPSGIPTYRDQAGNWLRGSPIQHREFLTEPSARQRYWSRSLVGWPVIASAQPNDAHRALAALERAGHIDLLVTQNVDRLHQRAGSHRVVDLHGRLDRVQCLSCGAAIGRDVIQRELERDNPALLQLGGALRPDGDADLADCQLAAVIAPHCRACNGIVMPDVVFFGGTVPHERVARVNEAVAAADALLVVGSSLKVFSGFRFCRLAARLGKPIAIINPGPTRADDLAVLRIAQCAERVLPALAARLYQDTSADAPPAPTPSLFNNAP
jgi:NAD-dependent SIR2 family protein deacetylase